jgi:phage-related protein
MSLEAIIALTSAQIGIVVSVIAGVKWLVKKYLSELRPNGGSSIHDKINKEVIPMLKELRKEQVGIGEKVAKLEGRFEQHVDEGE